MGNDPFRLGLAAPDPSLRLESLRHHRSHPDPAGVPPEETLRECCRVAGFNAGGSPSPRWVLSVEYVAPGLPLRNDAAPATAASTIRDRTIVLITHSIEEADLLGDRIA
eukprot:gene46188-56510_t